MIDDNIIKILAKVVNQQPLSQSEQAQLDNWLGADVRRQELLNELKNDDRLFTSLQQRYAFDTSEDWRKMSERLRADGAIPPRNMRVVNRSWFRYAAAAVLLLGSFTLWYTLSDQKAKTPGHTVQSKEIAPATHKALLTIGNNAPIDLSSEKSGIAVGEEIVYDDGERIAEAGHILTLTTPRGGQYQLTLPDGSKVTLNAASFIRFPSRFSDQERVVELGGEAYLEVAQNAVQPFIVKAAGTEVQVLGTSFNINAYNDEHAIRTTLVEGSVKVKSAGREVILKPGQQAAVLPDGQQIRITQSADSLEQAIAWKSGIFDFNNANIQGMMRQLSRWYDVDVVYEGQIPVRVFEGKMRRDIPLSGALKILELNKIKFRVEGRKIIVMP